MTAAFRDTQLAQLPVSVTVLDREELRETTQQHFEEAIRQVPNLNLSGEGSRARYFQLRGVGELEQYEGSPNPSIGFIVDDIDFSGLGSIGTLFDIDRVEVLRGPQGTRYGANALGGLIYLRSMEPTRSHTATAEITAGSDGTAALGAAAGGPLGERAAYRASVQKYENDGFRDNVFLGRHDTYGRDELTARGKLAWTPSDRLTVDFAGLYVDVDNGYDAWAIDNGFKTYSDKPGRDAQRSKAGSVRVTLELPKLDLVSITGVADTDAVFSFDADWGNAAYWAPYVYDYVEGTQRERRTYNEELRLLSKPGAIAGGRGDWLVGVYALDLNERNDHRVAGVYTDPFCGSACDLVARQRRAQRLRCDQRRGVRPGARVAERATRSHGRSARSSGARRTTTTARATTSRRSTTCAAANWPSTGGSRRGVLRTCGSRAATRPAASTSRWPASISPRSTD